jgi:hypothetical protein
MFTKEVPRRANRWVTVVTSSEHKFLLERQFKLFARFLIPTERREHRRELYPNMGPAPLILRGQTERVAVLCFS